LIIAYILELEVPKLSEFRDGIMSHFRGDVQLNEGHLLRAYASSVKFFPNSKIDSRNKEG
jgi:hypothetical protein